MSFTDPDYLADILTEILDVISDALTAAGRPVDRVLRSPGVPAWDCGLLAVYPRVRVVSNETNTDPRAMRKQIRHNLDVNVLLTRCLTSVKEGVPTATQVDADGAGFATDMWIVERALTVASQQSAFLPGGCTIARLNPVIPASPQGGYSGMTTTLEVALG